MKKLNAEAKRLMARIDAQLLELDEAMKTLILTVAAGVLLVLLALMRLVLVLKVGKEVASVFIGLLLVGIACAALYRQMQRGERLRKLV
jgi:uncharacterized membrane protein